MGDADPTKGVPWIHFLICLGGKRKSPIGQDWPKIETTRMRLLHGNDETKMFYQTKAKLSHQSWLIPSFQLDFDFVEIDNGTKSRKCALIEHLHKFLVLSVVDTCLQTSKHS